MARIVEGIKELLKGKDDDDHEYRYRRDQRRALGSKKYDGYSANASPEGRSGYLADGRSGYYADGRSGYPAEGRSGYPVTGTVDGRSGYTTNSIPAGRSPYPADGRSGYPVTTTVDGRSGYPANSSPEVRSSYPTEGRSPYPSEGRSPYPSEGRGGYPVSAAADGRSAYSPDHFADGRSGYPTDGRSGYPVSATADGRSGYPVSATADGRSGYPVSGTADGRSGYPVSATADGRSGYPVNGTADGRSGYPVSATADGRSGYPVSGTADGRSGYPTDGRSGYPVSATADGRSGYPVSATADGRSGYPVSATADGHSGYPVSATADGRSGYPVSASAGGYRVPPGRQVVDDDYVRSSYDTRSEARGEYRQPYAASTRESEYGQSYGIRDASPRAGSEYRTSPRVEIPPRGEYVRTTQPSPREYQSPASGRSVIELMVPMCCVKCKEKVQEELSEVEGVDSVRCDPKNSRVIVTGDQFIDIERCLTKAERAVKKKCELVSNQAEGGTPNSKTVTSPSGYYETVAKTGILTPPPESNSRGSPSGRPTLGRMPSFASGKVTQYDGVGPRGRDYEAKDYTGFRRMPSFGKSRHHEAEYISSYDERPEPRASSHRELNAPIRRMPSFNRSRYHDAEYMAADDDRDYSPRSFYDNGSSYTASYNDRPSLHSQVSFSKIPVENPNYVKQIANY